MSHYLTEQAVDDLASRLSARDLAILQSVTAVRFMSGAQLTSMHFVSGADDAASARAARRALLRLVQLDCLTRLPRQVGGVRAGSAGFVYHLGLAGQKLAMRCGWLPSRRGRRPRSPGLAFLGHSLSVAELHTRLVEADRSHRLELLTLSAEPACWRRYSGIGTQRLVLKPDSFTRFALGEWEFSYFIEVDRGTEGSRTLLGKLRDYLAYAASGVEQRQHGVFPKVLWTVEDEARAAVIRGCIEQLAPGVRELFGVAEFDRTIDLMAEPSSQPEAA